MSATAAMPTQSIGRLSSALHQTSTINRLVLAIAIVAVLAGFGLRIALAWQDLATLTLKALPDDAFYYFLTAENISNGKNITFDGFTLSNGYHPLWLFSLVPVYLLPGRELPLHVALTMSSAFDVIAACLVAFAVLRLTGNTVAGLFALCFYLFIPQNVFSAINGVESALTAMLLATLLLVTVEVWRVERPAWLGWSLATGLLGGLTMLARLDAALVVAAVFVAIWHLQGFRNWKAFAAMCGVAALIAAPWFIWSWIAIGTPIPVSGESATWLEHRHFQAAHPGASPWDFVEEGLRSTKFIFLTQLPALYFPDKAFAALLLAIGSVVTAHFVSLSRGSLRADTARQLLIAVPPLAGFLTALLINSGYRWFVREWYVAWGMPAVVLFGGVFFAYTARVIRELPFSTPSASELGEPAALGLFAALALVFSAAYIGEGRETWRVGPYFFQSVNMQAAAYLRDNSAPDDRVAAFNAGVVGYFSDRTVVNLDGVVNPDAFEALQDHRLAQYLRDVDIRFVADRQGAWTFLPAYIRPDDWSQSLWGEDPNEAMMPVADIGRGGIATQYRVWEME